METVGLLEIVVPLPYLNELPIHLFLCSPWPGRLRLFFQSTGLAQHQFVDTCGSCSGIMMLNGVAHLMPQILLSTLRPLQVICVAQVLHATSCQISQPLPNRGHNTYLSRSPAPSLSLSLSAELGASRIRKARRPSIFGGDRPADMPGNAC